MGLVDYQNDNQPLKLRIPKSLHKALADRSRQEGISMNQYCLFLLSNGAYAVYDPKGQIANNKL